MKHIKGLDTLRAFAVSVVIVYHWGPIFQSKSLPDFVKTVIFPDGLFGVTLFYVLSGYLIISILLKARDLDASKGLVLRNFYIRRSLRIFPAYYLTIAILWLVSFPGIRDDIAYYLTYSMNFLIYTRKAWSGFGPAWSLCVEEQFYLICPWIIVLVNKKYLKTVLFSLIVIGVVSTFLTIDYFNGYLPILPWNCFDAFGIGGLYAYSKMNDKSLDNFSRFLNIAAPIAIGVIIYWKWITYVDNVEYNMNVSFLKRFTDSIVSIWLIHLVIDLKPGFFRYKVMENRFLALTGRISYGIYLFHTFIPILYKHILNNLDLKSGLISQILTNPYSSYAINLAILFGFALLSYQLIEKPILSLKEKFNY